VDVKIPVIMAVPTCTGFGGHWRRVDMKDWISSVVMHDDYLLKDIEDKIRMYWDAYTD